MPDHCGANSSERPNLVSLGGGFEQYSQDYLHDTRMRQWKEFQFDQRVLDRTAVCPPDRCVTDNDHSVCNPSDHQVLKLSMHARRRNRM